MTQIATCRPEGLRHLFVLWCPTANPGKRANARKCTFLATCRPRSPPLLRGSARKRASDHMRARQHHRAVAFVAKRPTRTAWHRIKPQGAQKDLALQDNNTVRAAQVRTSLAEFAPTWANIAPTWTKPREHGPIPCEGWRQDPPPQPHDIAEANRVRCREGFRPMRGLQSKPFLPDACRRCPEGRESGSAEDLPYTSAAEFGQSSEAPQSNPRMEPKSLAACRQGREFVAPVTSGARKLCRSGLLVTDALHVVCALLEGVPPPHPHQWPTTLPGALRHRAFAEANIKEVPGRQPKSMPDLWKHGTAKSTAVQP